MFDFTKRAQHLTRLHLDYTPNRVICQYITDKLFSAWNLALEMLKRKMLCVIISTRLAAQRRRCAQFCHGARSIRIFEHLCIVNKEHCSAY